MTAFAMFRSIRHDYAAYIKQWDLVLEGVDPWSTSNNYGPLHNLLAYFAVSVELGPKVFMTVAFIVVNFLLVMLLLASGTNAVGLYSYAILIP